MRIYKFYKQYPTLPSAYRKYKQIASKNFPDLTEQG